MTALGEPSPRAENTEDGREEKTPARRFQPGTIKQLFRDLKNALTGKDDQPAPEVKRKRREETGRAFRMTARKLMRRTIRLPRQAFARATAYLADTLDWLNLWHHHDDIAEEIQPATTRDHLYPHL